MSTGFVPFDLEERKRLWNAGPIGDKLPIKFANGTEWQHVSGHCAQCDAEIAGQFLCGEVSETFKEIYLVKAVAYCHECKLATCYRWNLKEDGISGYDKNGNWGTWKAHRMPLWKKILKAFIR